MEPFNLLKLWRSPSGGGGGGGGATESTIPNIPTTTGATESTSLNIPTTIGATESHKKLEPEEKDDDDGPFFDLEFTVPDDDDDDDDGGGGGGEDEGDCDSVGTDTERDYNFTVSSSSSCTRTDPNLSLSPSDDLFFKGSFVQLEQSPTSEPNSKPQFHVSLLKSATKFRVFMLGFKKAKSTDKVEINGDSPKVLKQGSQKQTKFEILQKTKVEEVPIISLFTRENSMRSSGNKINKQSFDEIRAEEKKFAKDVLQKYLKMIKPLYVRVSKRYGEKMKFSGNLSSPVQKSSPKLEIDEEIGSSNLKSQKQGNLPSGLRVVCKHLGKSRSASAAVTAIPPMAFQTRKQNDSLLQQEDGIQSAILHCKRSFNASSRDSSLLSRSTSDPSHEKFLGVLQGKRSGKEESR